MPSTQLVLDDFLGRQIQLLGQTPPQTWDAAFAAAHPAVPIFQANTVNIRTRQHATVVAFVVVTHPGGNWPTGTLQILIGVDAIPNNWASVTWTGATLPGALTIYPGQAFSGDPLTMPGRIADGSQLTYTLIQWSTTPPTQLTDVIVSAYGWPI